MKRKTVLKLLSLATVTATTVTTFSSKWEFRDASLDNVWKQNLAYVNFNERNDANFKPYEKYHFNNWMKNVSDEKTLSQLSIPSTHDSDAFNGHGFFWTFGWTKARTQALTITRQLNMGIRGFDLRSDRDLNMRHGPTFLNDNFENIMSQFARFLKENPSEFVVFRIKDEADAINVNDQYSANLASKNYMNVLEKYKNMLYNPEGIHPYKLSWKMKDLRGKIVVMNFWHHKVNTSHMGGSGYWYKFRKDTTQDEFNINNANDKLIVADKLWKKSNVEPLKTNWLFANFLSFASGGNPDYNAERMNPKALEYLRNNEQLTRLGFVYMDFPGPSLIQSIYKRNFYFTDEELKNGYYRNWVWNDWLNISSNPVSNSNKISIRGRNLYDYNIEVYVSPKGQNNYTKVAQKHINENVSNALLTLDNYKFTENQDVKIKAYRTVAANPFYEARNVNQFESSSTTIPSQYASEYKQFVKTVNDYKAQQNTYSNFALYLDAKFLNILSTMEEETPEHVAMLQQLKEKFAQLNNAVNQQNEKISQLTAELNNLPNLTVLTQENVSKIANISEKYNQAIGSIINTSDDLASLNSFFASYDDLINNLKEIQNVVNTAKAKENTLSEIFNFDLPYLETKKAKLTTIVSNFNNQLLDISNLFSFDFASWKSQLNNFSSNLDAKINGLTQINNLLTSNQIANGNIFAHQINAYLEDTQEVQLQNVLNLINNFVNAISLANAQINEYTSLQSTYKFEKYKYGNLVEKYTQVINLLKQELARKNNIDIQVSEYIANLNQVISQIKEIDSKIKVFWNSVVNAETKNMEADQLSEEQKQIFYRKITQLTENEYDASEFNKIEQNIDQLNNIQPLTQINKLENASLNLTTKKHYLNLLNSTINVKNFLDIVSETQSLDHKAATLEKLHTNLTNYLNSELISKWEENQKQEFKTDLSNAKNYLDAELETLNLLEKHIEKLTKWLAKLEMTKVQEIYRDELETDLSRFEENQIYSQLPTNLKEEIKIKHDQFRANIFKTSEVEKLKQTINDHSFYLEKIKNDYLNSQKEQQDDLTTLLEEIKKKLEILNSNLETHKTYNESELIKVNKFYLNLYQDLKTNVNQNTQNKEILTSLSNQIDVAIRNYNQEYETKLNELKANLTTKNNQLRQKINQKNQELTQEKFNLIHQEFEAIMQRADNLDLSDYANLQENNQSYQNFWEKIKNLQNEPEITPAPKQPATQENPLPNVPSENLNDNREQPKDNLSNQPKENTENGDIKTDDPINPPVENPTAKEEPNLENPQETPSNSQSMAAEPEKQQSTPWKWVGIALGSVSGISLVSFGLAKWIIKIRKK
ncbi:hypothetical protein [Mycoplasma buteonis]|uniref:hypothetical protein n=1 Tax=Mycoplasma buteonis TaxID=171280 RepID=UPI00055CF7B8|nr:hypothetical protein [Mycoplasma buteonis]